MGRMETEARDEVGFLPIGQSAKRLETSQVAFELGCMSGGSVKIPFSAYDFFGYLATGFLMLAAVDYALKAGWVLNQSFGLIASLIWLLMAYVIGHIVAHISSHLLESKLLRGILRSPEEHLFGQPMSKGWARLFPGLHTPLPKTTQERVLRRAKKEGVPAPGEGFFLHCHPLANRDPATQERLSSFLNLYGFCRNLTMGCLLAVPVLLYGAFRDAHWPAMEGLDRGRLFWALALLGASAGMFYRYLKFFRHYTVEVFVAYAELPSESSKAASAAL